MAGALYAGGVFEPEVILPVQFFPPAAAAAERPERRLMLAVLQEAVLTLARHAGDERARARRLVRDVERWVAQRRSDWPFSFENICANLNLDAGALRAGLQRLLLHSGCEAVVRRLPFGRHAVSERHRVSVPRSHHAKPHPAEPARAARRRALTGLGTPAGRA